MHTVAIECSDKAYSHIVYMVEHLLKGEAIIKDNQKYEPNEETKAVFQEIREGKNIAPFDPKELQR